MTYDKEWHRNYYQKNKKKKLEQVEAYRKANQEKIKAWRKKPETKKSVSKNVRELRQQRSAICQEIKLQYGCQNKLCQCRHELIAAELDFHHLDMNEKENTIGRVLRAGGLSCLVEEINKCTVLCAHCHRRIHHDPKLVEINLVCSVNESRFTPNQLPTSVEMSQLDSRI